MNDLSFEIELRWSGPDANERAQSPAADDDDVRAQRRTFLPVQTNAQTIAIRSPAGSGRSTELLPRLRGGGLVTRSATPTSHRAG